MCRNRYVDRKLCMLVNLTPVPCNHTSQQQVVTSFQFLIVLLAGGLFDDSLCPSQLFTSAPNRQNIFEQLCWSRILGSNGACSYNCVYFILPNLVLDKRTWQLQSPCNRFFQLRQSPCLTFLLWPQCTAKWVLMGSGW